MTIHPGSTLLQAPSAAIGAEQQSGLNSKHVRHCADARWRIHHASQGSSSAGISPTERRLVRLKCLPVACRHACIHSLPMYRTPVQMGENIHLVLNGCLAERTAPRWPAACHASLVLMTPTAYRPIIYAPRVALCAACASDRPQWQCRGISSDRIMIHVFERS